MNTLEFLEKCIKSEKLKETINRNGFNSSLWYTIDHCIDEVEEDGDIKYAAQFLDEWMESMEDYESIDELLDYCSPEFCKELEETA